MSGSVSGNLPFCCSGSASAIAIARPGHFVIFTSALAWQCQAILSFYHGSASHFVIK